jgi:4,5-DOPA dioxygenase extradiol
MVPALFLAHGSPMTAIEDTVYTRFLNDLGRQYQPDAIVIFTAHWETDVLTISSIDDEYETIYDFGGFPPELYAVKYPAKGSKQVAAKLAKLFDKQGIVVRLDTQRGLDHGSWTLLAQMYPKADIPVVQISVNPFLTAQEQYAIGLSLRGLGSDNIMVIGSGVTVHNLRAVKFGQRDAAPEQWAVDFDDWLVDKIQSKDLASLFNYEAAAPNARLAVPRDEHFVPLLIALGSGDPLNQAEVIHRSYDYGALSNLCFQF